MPTYGNILYIMNENQSILEKSETHTERKPDKKQRIQFVFKQDCEYKYRKHFGKLFHYRDKLKNKPGITFIFDFFILL